MSTVIAPPNVEFLERKVTEAASLVGELAKIRARLAALENPQSELSSEEDCGSQGRAAL